MKSIKIHPLIELKIPQVPNYIMHFGKGETKYSIADLTDDELDSVAEEWKLNLKNRAHEIREGRDNSHTET